MNIIIFTGMEHKYEVIMMSHAKESCTEVTERYNNSDLLFF